MARSLKKGPYIDPKLLKKVLDMDRQGAKKVIKTWKWNRRQLLNI